MKLLRITVLTLTGLISAATLKAQYISIGPSVGFQHTWVTYDLPEGSHSVFNPGFNAGASFVYSTDSHWGAGADLKYSAEGSSVKTDNPEVTTDWNTSYLGLPIRAIYFFGDYGNAIRPKIFAGPSLGFLLNSKLDGSEAKDETSTFDVGLHAGAGVNFRIAEGIWLNTDITYTQGLLDVTKDNAFNTANNLNGNVGINIGVLFGL